MSGYHGYVFDKVRRRFVGKFDEMYRAEQRDHFDSWQQEDARNLTRRLCLSLLEEFNFARVLDIGCGKGALTHRLKRANNTVTGLDVSEAALAAARGRYPDVEFVRVDVQTEALPGDIADPYDLIVCLEALSYVSDWPALLGRMSQQTRHALVALYLPENPIGFVKSFEDLVEGFSRHFRIDEHIHLITRRQLVLFGTSALGAGGTDARV